MTHFETNEYKYHSEQGNEANQHHVWIVNHYNSALHKSNTFGRHFGMAQHLSKQGWTASLIGASTLHPEGRQAFKPPRFRRTEKESGVAFRWIWANSYSKGIFRILNMVSFSIGALFPKATFELDKPDVVIGSTVHPLAAWAAARLAKRHSVPFIFEIRDVWPDAMVHLGKLHENSLITKMIERLMRSLTSQSSAVISPLPGVGDYVKKLGLEKDFVWISNGVDGQQELPNDDPKSENFTFMYLGSFGFAMDIETQLNAFDQFASTDVGSRAEFRLVGTGPRHEEVRNYAKSLASADRISFESRIPRKEVLKRAQEAHCLVHALHDHAVYEYGISPNKLFDYLFSSRPILFACNAALTPISGSGAEVTVAAEDVDGLAKAMEMVATLPAEERKAMGEKGRSHVLSNFTYFALSKKLAKLLDKVQADG